MIPVSSGPSSSLAPQQSTPDDDTYSGRGALPDVLLDSAVSMHSVKSVASSGHEQPDSGALLAASRRSPNIGKLDLSVVQSSLERSLEESSQYASVEWSPNDFGELGGGADEYYEPVLEEDDGSLGDGAGRWEQQSLSARVEATGQFSTEGSPPRGDTQGAPGIVYYGARGVFHGGALDDVGSTPPLNPLSAGGTPQLREGPDEFGGDQIAQQKIASSPGGGSDENLVIHDHILDDGHDSSLEYSDESPDASPAGSRGRGSRGAPSSGGGVSGAASLGGSPSVGQGGDAVGESVEAAGAMSSHQGSSRTIPDRPSSDADELIGEGQEVDLSPVSRRESGEEGLSGSYPDDIVGAVSGAGDDISSLGNNDHIGQDRDSLGSVGSPFGAPRGDRVSAAGSEGGELLRSPLLSAPSSAPVSQIVSPVQGISPVNASAASSRGGPEQLQSGVTKRKIGPASSTVRVVREPRNTLISDSPVPSPSDGEIAPSDVAPSSSSSRVSGRTNQNDSPTNHPPLSSLHKHALSSLHKHAQFSSGGSSSSSSAAAPPESDSQADSQKSDSQDEEDHFMTMQLQQTVAQLRIQNERLEARNAELEEARAGAAAEAHRTKLKDEAAEQVRAELAAAQQELAQKTAMLNKVQDTNLAAAQKLEDVHAEYNELAQLYKELQDENQHQQEERRRAEEQLHADFQRRAEEFQQRYNQGVADYGRDLRAAHAEEMAAEVGNKEAEIQEKEAQNQKIRTELEDFKTQAEAQRTNIEGQVAELQRRWEEVAAQNQALRWDFWACCSCRENDPCIFGKTVCGTRNYSSQRPAL